MLQKRPKYKTKDVELCMATNYRREKDTSGDVFLVLNVQILFEYKIDFLHWKYILHLQSN